MASLKRKVKGEMKPECENNSVIIDLQVPDPTGADFLNEACYTRGQSNGKEFRLAVSNKGKRSLVRDGYMYRLDHSGKDKLSWRCSTRGCPAHLKTDLLVEVIVQDNEKSHSHAADAHKFEKQLLRIVCKRKAVEDCSSRTQDIISSEMSRLSGLNLTTKNTKFLQLAMYRERKKVFPKMARTTRSGHIQKQEVHLDGATTIPQPHIPDMPPTFYTQPPTAAFQPHFDMLTEDGDSDYQHQDHHAHHHHPHSDNSLQPLQHLHQQQHSEHLPQLQHQHQQQLLHHELQPLENTLPQTVFPSNHLLSSQVIVALNSDREPVSIHQLNSCAMQKKLCYADVQRHQDLLSDKVCILAFRRALQENRAQLKNATVLDVGAGLGILSHFAVHAGAARVYSVEPSDMAVHAEKVAKENGIDSSIFITQNKVESVDIPVKVDAIISDWMGPSLMHHSKLSSFLIARDRFLRQGGQMYPSAATLYLAPVTSDNFQERFKSWQQMKNLYGVSMESLVNLTKDTLTEQACIQHLEAESVLSNSCQVCQFDLKIMTHQDAQLVEADFSFRCYSQNVMHGFATWFVVSFPGNVTIDTSPFALKTHWGQTVLYLRTPLSVRQDSKIKGSFRMCQLSESHRSWGIEIEFQLNRGRKYRQHWQFVE